MKRKAKRKGRTIESEARTRATPRQAWEAFAHPERLVDWWVDKVEGRAELGAEMICGFVFLMCYQQRVRAIVQGWKLSAADAEALEKDLGDSLDALVALS